MFFKFSARISLWLTVLLTDKFDDDGGGDDDDDDDDDVDLSRRERGVSDGRTSLAAEREGVSVRDKSWSIKQAY